jgi:V/A-type H+-transporting ATPase subunit I
MRIDVKKFLFIGLKNEKDPFFKQAQEIGIIHFIEPHQKMKEVPVEISRLTAAIKVVRGLPVVEQEEIDEFLLADGYAQKILELQNKIEKLSEEQRLLHLEMVRVAVFGNFSNEDISYIERMGHRKIQFFFAKHGIATGPAREIILPSEVIFVGTEHELDYFIAINKEPKQYPKLIEMKIEMPLGKLKEKAEQVRINLHNTEQQLKSYAKYNLFLHRALIYRWNGYSLNVAKNSARYTLDDTLFAISGWVPENKFQELQTLAQKRNVHIEEIAIEPSDHVPTYLENKGAHKMGEDVIKIYDTPSITDKDPSLWVLLSFALFFSFIVGDAGYGAVFLAVALYLRYKHQGLQGAQKRVLNLVTILCVATIGWGIFTNSFFGLTISPYNPIRKMSGINWLVEQKAAYHMQRQDAVYKEWVDKFPDLKGETDPKEFIAKGKSINAKGKESYDILNKFNDNILLDLALLIGCVHIILSLARYMGRNWKALGWILFIIGGYLYIPSYLQATSFFNFLTGIPPEKVAMDGLYLMAGGVGLALLIALIQDKLYGIFEVMNVIQIFADIMSYLRLYALGLAGTIVMATINDAAAGLGFILGLVLIVIGHGLNMALAIMGGVIHGLRLNFIEWYHYSFEGGGKEFKPLRIHKSS